MGWFNRRKVNGGLAKTRGKMASAIDDMMGSYDEFSDDLYTELEEILVMGDVGVTTSVQIVEELKSRVRSERIKKTSDIKQALEDIIADMLEGGEDLGLVTIPSVLLMIGVNGSGKTTTIGKLASMYRAEGKKVILGAADTFRAAAIDQLAVWAQRSGADLVRHQEGADPAAVIFDTIEAGKARDCDIIICDTAGRLQNKKNLMDELAKIYKVLDRELPYSDREILLVLDATTGQNAVSQAKEFSQVAEITGIVLTKLDGTARGGIVLSIKNELKIPVKFIGVGEGIDDLQPFDPHEFARSLFEGIDERSKEEREDDDLFKKASYEDIELPVSENEGENENGAEESGSFDEGRDKVDDIFSDVPQNASSEDIGAYIAARAGEILGELDDEGAEPKQDDQTLPEDQRDDIEDILTNGDDVSDEHTDDVKDDEAADEDTRKVSEDESDNGTPENVTGEDDNDEPEKPVKKKGFFGSLFGRKK